MIKMELWVNVLLLISPDYRFELVMGINISMFFRIITSNEPLNGQNQSDESWTWALIMCLGGINLVG
jgi:hypothetical protein